MGAQLRAAYDGGATVRVLAAARGWSYGFTYRLLVEAGMIPRRRSSHFAPGGSPQGSGSDSAAGHD